MIENIRGWIERRIVLLFSERQGDNGCEHQSDVEEDTDELHLRHNPTEEDGNDAVCEYRCHVCAVDYCTL